MEIEEHAHYIEMFKAYFEEQAKYVEKVRGLKHDMQAHMIVLHYYLEADRSDKAKEYLKSIMEKHKDCEWAVADVGNDMVNAVICSTLKRSLKPITFHHFGLLPEELRIEDMDICTLFSNIFSNCVEACDKLENTPGSIMLEIGQCGNKLSIMVENPIERQVDSAILGVSTTKAEKEDHGYGIRNMQKIVEKYNGQMSFEVTEDIFRIKILFPDVVNCGDVC